MPRGLVRLAGASDPATEDKRKAAAASALGVGGVEVDLGRREAMPCRRLLLVLGTLGELVSFDLLAFMAENEGLVLSRGQLLDNVWCHGWYGDEPVDVHVRQAEEAAVAQLPLATVWGVGYRLG